MRGIVFTTDALFSLIIAGTATAILLYFVYSPQTPYLISYSGTQSILTDMLSLHLAQISNGSTIASQINYQDNASYSAWPEFGGSQLSDAWNQKGPGTPALEYVLQETSAISVAPEAAYGNVYLVSGNVISAVNATSGAPVWNGSYGAYPINSFAIYGGTLAYFSGNELYGINAFNGSESWNGAVVTSAPSSRIVIYQNEALFASGNSIYADYMVNGTLAWTSGPLPFQPNSIAVVNGTIAAGSSNLGSGGGGLGLLTQSGGELWYSLPSNELTTGIAAFDGMIAFGSGSNACAFSLQGTQSYCTATSSNVVGVAVSGSTAIYQTTNAIYAVSPSGGIDWEETGIPGEVGRPLATPALTYAEWGLYNITAYNTTKGTEAWSTSEPYAGLGNASLAYGRLYVPASTYLLAYGACTVGNGGSLLEAITYLYINRDGSCADSIANQVDALGNYSIDSGTALLPYQSAASFNGLSGHYISTGGSGLISGSGSRSVFAWVYFTGGLSDPIYSYGNHGTLGQGADLSIYKGYLNFSAGGDDMVQYTTAFPQNSWELAGYTYVAGSNEITLYVGNNGEIVPLSYGLYTTLASNDISDIGKYNGGRPGTFNGMISNVQTYDTALTANQVVLMYQQGLSSGPVAGAGLESWYPLDGNSNDYGPAGNTGYPVSVGFQDSGYVPPGINSSSSISHSSVPVSSSFYSAVLNGKSSYIATGESGMPSGSHARSAFAWIEIPSPATGNAIGNVFSYGSSSSGEHSALQVNLASDQLHFGSGSNGYTYNSLIPYNKWVFVGYSYQQGSDSVTLFINRSYSTGTLSGNSPPNTVLAESSIGAYYSGSSEEYFFPGQIADVQLYNASLDPAQELALYSEGIDGPPLMGSGLVGWWPLDGNANDYSGNGNYGTQYALNYTVSSWLYNIGILKWH